MKSTGSAALKGRTTKEESTVQNSDGCAFCDAQPDGVEASAGRSVCDRCGRRLDADSGRLVADGGRVTDATLSQRKANQRRVREDPKLTPGEKETSISFSKETGVAVVYSANAAICRRLLAHPEAHIRGCTVVDGDGRPDVPVDAVDGRDVVGVRADIPIGVLKIGLRPRSSGGQADVVTSTVLDSGGDD